MSVQQEHATSETATLTTTESGGVYQSLFDKINLTPVSSIQEIDLWQNSETLADASPDERVTAAIHVLLSCLAKSGENVVKLDKSLLDFHIDDLDQKISKQLDAVMHHPEFSSFRHRGGMLRHDAPERYYHTRVKRGPSGLHDTWLILGGDAFDADRMLEDETLSLSLTGTNGHLPRKALQSTLLDRPVHASQNVLRVRNLCAPTQPCYPPARDRFHWRVLSHLGSNFLSMMDNAEILRGTLALYDWTESEMNRRRLEAIVDVQHSLIQRFERGFLLRGVDIQVTLDSNGFAGEGDITLFGELLHRFFALYADIHLFTQLTLILQPTGKCLQWTEHHSQRVPG